MKNSMKSVSVSPIIIVIAVVLVGAVAFFGGMKYQRGKVSMMAGRFAGANGLAGARGGQGGPGGQNRFGQGIRPINGEILSVDDKSMTVKMMDGSTKIVVLSETTSINKAAEAVKTDLKTGEKVAVFGAQNPDGSVTAQSIQLNPMARMMGGNATPSATPMTK